MTPQTLPLRAALIGLSASAKTSWAANAHLPGILSEAGRSKITIKALLNSSVDAAKSAVKTYKLPADTKTYGKPEDLAADADIDLVICNTRVDKHYETTIPSIRAGKDVFIEWPIAAKKEHIDEIIQTARKTGSRVAVGLQGRWAAPVLKLKELIDGGNGALGKILSVDVRMYGGTNDRSVLPEGLKYFTERAVGGNSVVIGVGHSFDYILSTVGDLDPASIRSKSQIQRPNVPIREQTSTKIIGFTRSDVPDLLSFSGTIVSPQAVQNAALSWFFRRGQPFKGTPALVWSIVLEHGEIRLVAPSGMSLQASAYDEPVTIQVHHHEDDTLQDISWEWNERQKDLPVVARSVTETLIAFAEGRPEGDGWVDIADAAKRAEILERFLDLH